MPGARPRSDPRVRFWAKVKKSLTTRCWEWQGALAGETFYGVFNRGDQLVLAHRYAYELANGAPPPAGMVVMHRCDNTKCVNPMHLRVGTHRDNNRDMDAKGRRRTVALRGEDHGNSKLTKADVADARWAHRMGATAASLARLYGVSATTMASALKGRSWK